MVQILHRISIVSIVKTIENKLVNIFPRQQFLIIKYDYYLKHQCKKNYFKLCSLMKKVHIVL